MKKVYLAVLATLVMCAAVMFGAMTAFGAPSSGKLTADDYVAIEQLVVSEKSRIPARANSLSSPTSGKLTAEVRGPDTSIRT